jgi:hypothetical protein
MARSAFDTLHDLSQRIRFSSIAFQRGKEQMNMVWHYHECMHIDFSAILEKTMIKDQSSGFFGKYEVVARTKGNEI